jgi:hypothetical protein
MKIQEENWDGISRVQVANPGTDFGSDWIKYLAGTAAGVGIIAW